MERKQERSSRELASVCTPLDDLLWEPTVGCKKVKTEKIQRIYRHQGALERVAASSQPGPPLFPLNSTHLQNVCIAVKHCKTHSKGNATDKGCPLLMFVLKKRLTVRSRPDDRQRVVRFSRSAIFATHPFFRRL